MLNFVQRINLIAALLVALNARLCFCGINLGINSLIHYIENIDRSVIFNYNQLYLEFQRVEIVILPTLQETLHAFALDLTTSYY